MFPRIFYENFRDRYLGFFPVIYLSISKPYVKWFPSCELKFYKVPVEEI